MAQVVEASYPVDETVEVLWEERWWAARVVRLEGDRDCMTDVGWDSSWDECVGSERIRLVAEVETTDPTAASERMAAANRLNQQGIQQAQTSQYREALRSFEQALAIYRETSVRTAFPQQSRNGEAAALNNLGLAYRSLSEYQRAIDSYQQALPILQAVGDRNGEALALMNLGSAYLSLSEYQRAIAYYQQALPILQAVGDRNGEALALMNLGLAYDSLSEYQRAIDYHQQALPILQAVGDRNGEAKALNNLGSAYLSLSEYQRAIAYYQQALPIYQAVGDRNGEAAALTNLGSAYRSLSEYQRAIDSYQQALPIYQAVGDRNGEANALTGLGSAYLSLSESQRAIAYYQQALPIYQAVGDRNGEAGALNNLGLAYLSLSEYQRAIDSYQQALPILQAVGDRNGEAAALTNLGIAYWSLSEYQRAIDYFQQALPIYQAVGDRNGEAAALTNLGIAYLSLSEYQRAIDYFQQALPILQAVGDRAGTGGLLANIGKLLEAQDQPELAIVFLKQSVNVRESIRDSIRGLDSALQESYTKSVEEDYRRLADLLLQQGRVMEAQEVLDLLKLQELDDYLQNVPGNEQTARGVYTWEFEDQILADFEVAVQQGQDVEAFFDSAAVTTQVAELQRIAREQRIPQELLASLQDNLRQLERPAVLLYPLILEDRLELVLIPPNGLPVRRTVAVTEVELRQAIAAFRADITVRTSNPLPNAQQLYQWLIEPIADDLQQAGAETILYAADGALRYIPLAALHDGDQWLTQRYTINHITAASLTDFSQQGAVDLSILAGAFPEQGMEVDLGEEWKWFEGLPGAQTEVRNLEETIPETLALFSAAFNRAAIEPQLNNYTIVHFATHGEFRSGSPLDSFILLGDGNRITLLDLGDWQLSNVDLVVLSACQTAVSSAALGNGEEILGFGYQVQQTGADAAIASLWQVSDGGTQVLMNAFYAGLEQGMSKAAALQEAQRALISGDFSAVQGERSGDGTVGFRDLRTGLPPQVSSNLNHPYYWAPFILIGNGL
jgi:CHAT domain-containing protein/predicted negative regulator of RcsB-dependent stress response